jgi:hypothetical protein
MAPLCLKCGGPVSTDVNSKGTTIWRCLREGSEPNCDFWGQARMGARSLSQDGRIDEFVSDFTAQAQAIDPQIRSYHHAIQIAIRLLEKMLSVLRDIDTPRKVTAQLNNMTPEDAAKVRTAAHNAGRLIVAFLGWCVTKLMVTLHISRRGRPASEDSEARAIRQFVRDKKLKEASSDRRAFAQAATEFGCNPSKVRRICSTPAPYSRVREDMLAELNRETVPASFDRSKRDSEGRFEKKTPI